MQRQFSVFVCILVAALAFAVPASAQVCEPTQDQYGDQIQPPEGCNEPDEPTVGGLPFTGLDLGLMTAAAITIVGAGILIRRRAEVEER
jgi:hypothetical protein